LSATVFKARIRCFTSIREPSAFDDYGVSLIRSTCQKLRVPCGAMGTLTLICRAMWEFLEETHGGNDDSGVNLCVSLGLGKMGATEGKIRAGSSEEVR